MVGPFSGLLVVELGRYVSVPYCSQMLADGGARVIKIEPLDGDPYRSMHPVNGTMSRQFFIKNRGKESLPLEVSSTEGRGILDALLAEADVFLVNLSPKALRRNRLDFSSVSQLNGRIVYGSVSGFGRRGPDSDLPGMDVVAQARSGLLTSLGAEADGVPLHSEVQAADYATALLLFGGIASALYVREQTGRGQDVSTSLLGAALALQNNSVVHFEDHDQWRQKYVEVDLPGIRSNGGTSREMNAARQASRPDASGHLRYYRVYRASDGFVALGAGSPGTRAALRSVLADGASTALEDLPIEDIFLTHTVNHWTTILKQFDVPAARVYHVEEMVFDNHVLEEGLVVTIEDESVGRVRTLATPITMSETNFAARRPAPQFGEHSREILSALGYGKARIDGLIELGVTFSSKQNIDVGGDSAF